MQVDHVRIHLIFISISWGVLWAYPGGRFSMFGAPWGPNDHVQIQHEYKLSRVPPQMGRLWSASGSGHEAFLSMCPFGLSTVNGTGCFGKGISYRCTLLEQGPYPRTANFGNKRVEGIK